jgi:hypothetical protein
MAEHLGVQTAIGFNAGMCALGLAAAGLYYVTHREAIERADRAPAMTTASA